jgi:hypothetical protein
MDGITKKQNKDGSTEITVVFTAKAKKTAILSASGKMLLGYSSGFKTVDDTEGDKINVVYGWNAEK